MKLTEEQLRAVEVAAKNDWGYHRTHQVLNPKRSMKTVQKWFSKPEFKEAILNRKIQLAQGIHDTIQPTNDTEQGIAAQKPHIIGKGIQIDIEKIQKIEDLQRYGVIGYAMVLQEGFNTGRMSNTFKAVVDKILTRTGDLTPNPPKQVVKKVVFKIGNIGESTPHLKISEDSAEDKPVVINHLSEIRKFNEELNISAS